MSSAPPPPVWLPVGPQLRALARRRALRDAGFWMRVSILCLVTLLLLWPTHAIMARSLRGPFSYPMLLTLIALVQLVLVAYWFLICRTDAIAAKLQRTLPITVCRGCLYDTAAVPTDRCPECGAMIANTMPGVMP